MQTGQNSIAPESSLPQLGQVRWGSALMALTALQPYSEPKATPRSTEWCEIGQHRAWHSVVPFHKRMRYITPLNRVSEQNSFYRFLRCDALIMTFGHWARLRGRAPSLGSVADRCIPHAAGTLYHTWNGSVPKLSDDLLNQLYAVQNTPSVEEALETKHWSNAAFTLR